MVMLYLSNELLLFPPFVSLEQKLRVAQKGGKSPPDFVLVAAGSRGCAVVPSVPVSATLPPFRRTQTKVAHPAATFHKVS